MVAAVFPQMATFPRSPARLDNLVLGCSKEDRPESPQVYYVGEEKQATLDCNEDHVFSNSDSTIFARSRRHFSDPQKRVSAVEQLPNWDMASLAPIPPTYSSWLATRGRIWRGSAPHFGEGRKTTEPDENLDHHNAILPYHSRSAPAGSKAMVLLHNFSITSPHMTGLHRLTELCIHVDACRVDHNPLFHTTGFPLRSTRGFENRPAGTLAHFKTRSSGTTRKIPALGPSMPVSRVQAFDSVRDGPGQKWR